MEMMYATVMKFCCCFGRKNDPLGPPPPRSDRRRGAAQPLPLVPIPVPTLQGQQLSTITSQAEPPSPTSAHRNDLARQDSIRFVQPSSDNLRGFVPSEDRIPESYPVPDSRHDRPSGPSQVTNASSGLSEVSSLSSFQGTPTVTRRPTVHDFSTQIPAPLASPRPLVGHRRLFSEGDYPQSTTMRDVHVTMPQPVPNSERPSLQFVTPPAARARQGTPFNFDLSGGAEPGAEPGASLQDGETERENL